MSYRSEVIDRLSPEKSRELRSCPQVSHMSCRTRGTQRLVFSLPRVSHWQILGRVYGNDCFGAIYQWIVMIAQHRCSRDGFKLLILSQHFKGFPVVPSYDILCFMLFFQCFFSMWWSKFQTVFSRRIVNNVFTYYYIFRLVFDLHCMCYARNVFCHSLLLKFLYR